MVTAVCPSREMLRQYSSGSLPEPESDHVASHLEACPECQATIVTLADADDTLIGQLRTPVGAESFVGEPQLHAAMAEAIATPPAGENPRRMGLRPDPGLPEMLGEYRILEQLGHGGMGRVYKALHTKLDRVVAIKVLSGGRMESRQAMARFEREMKAVGRLDHPNIVRAHDAREIDGTPVLIMEFVEGLDLAEVVRRVGPLGVAEACEVVRQTALGLQRAHEHGLVHRDIKPSNIMLARGLAPFAGGLAPFSPQRGPEAQFDATAKKVPDPFGPAAPHVKILDLGLARLYTEGATGVSPMTSGDEMTGTGQAMGTADYMAPEQASDSRNVDIRADIYSLGCTLYKLLSGQAPFSGPQYRGALDKMNAHVSQPVPPIRRLAPEVPDALAAILDRMLAKVPCDRFAKPAEVSQALEPFSAGANLADLAARASSSPSPRTRVETGSNDEVGEDNEVGKSNEVGGDNESPLSLWERARVRAPAPGRRSTIKTILIGLALLGSLAAAFAAGVIITIQKNGQTYQLDIPANSRTTINEEGNATVGVSGGVARPERNDGRGESRERPATPFAKPQGVPPGPQMVVRNLTLVREVRGYGDFVPFEKTEFAPGQEVILYAEAENFVSEETPKGFRTRFHGSYEISDTRGQRVAFQELGNTDDYCRNQRRDLSLNYLVRLPKQINGGRHTLKLTLEDLRGQKTGQTSLEFTIKAIGGAASPSPSDQRGEASGRPGAPSATPQDGPPGQHRPMLVVYRLEAITPELALEVLQMLLAGVPDVRLSADTKAGNIVAMARPNEHATIQAALERLERVAKAQAARRTGKIRFNFRHQPWKEVLPWLAEQAGLSLDMDAPPEGTFNYTDDREYTPDEAIDMVNSVLRTKGYTLMRRGRHLVLTSPTRGVARPGRATLLG